MSDVRLRGRLHDLAGVLPVEREGTEVEIVERCGGGVVVLAKGRKYPLKVPARCVIEDEPEIPTCPTCGQEVAP
jgi:hypothetical protein